MIGCSVYALWLKNIFKDEKHIDYTSCLNVCVYMTVGAYAASFLASGLLGNSHRNENWFGALFGAAILLLFWSRKNKVSFWKASDLFAFGAPFLYAMVRINCFITGCCHGISASIPWAVDDWLTHSLIHPVQLYDSYLNVCLFLVLTELRDNKRPDGIVTLSFLIGNAFIRFFMEYFRWGVSATVLWGFITQGQVISLLIMIGAVITWRTLVPALDDARTQQTSQSALP